MDGEDIRFTGHITRYYPAVYYLPNGDPGYPAEGGEIENLEAFNSSGEKIDCPDELYEMVADQIHEAVEEAAYGPDPDAARDANLCGD